MGTAILSLICTGLASGLSLGLLACQGNGAAPAPTSPAADPTPLPTAQLSSGGAVSSAWGVYTFDLDAIDLRASLESVAAPRTAEALGDQLAPDITPFLKSSPCSDCFTVEGLSRTPSGGVAVDFGLVHPFPTTTARSDLSGFDTRAIAIIPGNKSFPQSPRVHTNGDGSPDLTVLGDFSLVANADGYTSHFDSKPADPALFNPPLAITGSVNPYIYFFTEDDPAPTSEGNPIANHRFTQSPVKDIQRMELALSPSVQQTKIIIVTETQYGVSALKNNPTNSPGGRNNPVYFLPAFNQLEAYRVDVEVTGDFIAGIPNQFVQAAVQIEDWQAGLTGSGAYGDLSQPSLIPETSDVIRVTAEVPGVQGALSTKTSPDSGSGVQGDPYQYAFSIQNTSLPSEGEYTGLISVVDSRDGTGSRLTATPGESVFGFVTYKPFTVTVVPNTSGNNPPVAVGSASPNPVATGATVNFSDSLSNDPDVGDGITLYEWDFTYDGVSFNVDASSATTNQASTVYTNPGGAAIVVTAALRVTDMGFLQDLTTVDITVNPNTGPSCNTTPPAAPTNFIVPNFPTPPYNGTSAANRISFSWNAVTGDPCVLGYAIYRVDARNGGTSVLINDTNGNNTLETADIISGTAYADTTLSGSGFKTSVIHYYYRIVTVKDNGAGGLVTSSIATAPKIYVFFDDFENRNAFEGTGTYSRTTSGFSAGRVNNDAFPGGTAFNNYGWQIAQAGAQGNGNNGSSRFLDESAYNANVPPIWSPTLHDPYEYAEDATTVPDGYWNAIGPNIWIAGNVNPLAGTSVNRMQIYHRYQMQTFGGGADEVCYATALPDAAWSSGPSGTWQFDDYRPLAYYSGKNYDGTTPQLPDFLNQAFSGPVGGPVPQQQVPAMQFFAGDYQTPAYGQPNWGPTVFSLTQAAAMTKPIIMFAHTGDPIAPPFQTFGWQIDDICIIAY